MSDLKENYDKITMQRKEITDELKKLEGNEKIKKYLELKKQNESLYFKQLSLAKKIRLESYETCNHILVYSNIDYDYYEGRTYRFCGCMKCGLDNNVLNGDRKYLRDYEKIMYDYLKDHYLTGLDTKIECNLDMACEIYSKIKEENPNIDDKALIKYFEIELNNMKTKNVTLCRKRNNR